MADVLNTILVRDSRDKTEAYWPEDDYNANPPKGTIVIGLDRRHQPSQTSMIQPGK